MGFLKTPKAPATPPPQPVPQVQDAAASDAARKEYKRSGFAKTVLTGALTPNDGRKTVLG